MKNDIKNELIEILNIFEEAYIQRDVNKIDNFMDSLFDKNENVIVVGTSGGEWCIGYEEVKDIFLSDWEYWGDLRIKADEATIIPLGNTALIYTTGTIKYSFYSNKDTYARYLGYIKEYFDEVSSDSKKTNKVKLTEINWKLCHLLNKWDGDERHYLWDLRISFVLIKKENRWIIKQMQFSLPVVGYLPDVRIDNIGDDIEGFKIETKKMKEWSINNTLVYKDEVLKLLKAFNDEYLKADKETSVIDSKYFASNNPLIINTDKTVYSSQEEIKKLIENHRAYYNKMELDYENCLINSNEDVVWIVTHGTMKKEISENSAFENTVDIIKNIFTSDLEDKDKLFNVRRRIADTFKENAKGEEYVWPFRFEAVLIQEKGNWVFKYLQFSLPFNYIFEGKTEAASILENNI
ncbi:nuclear transport factor 2 family protein [Clostridium sp.]|uniref:nuclear transport factor 2 family protein n=1 Tax=Clostridium sp. TaxID=1506 RepID=UPI0032179809